MIKKYILKKELPGLPVGSVIAYNPEGNAISCDLWKTLDSPLYRITTSVLQDTEWFEEFIEKPKFIKGKWYKLNHKPTNDLRYIKFDEIEKRPSYNCIYYSESIKDSAGGYNKRAGYIANTRMEEGLILVEDSEVEPYIKPKLMFGGKEVNIGAGKYESTTMIHCADFSCSLLHLNILYKSIIELTSWNVENGKFKVVEIDGIELPFENITIGCQTDRIDKLKEIIDTATKLMK